MRLADEWVCRQIFTEHAGRMWGLDEHVWSESSCWCLMMLCRPDIHPLFTASEATWNEESQWWNTCLHVSCCTCIFPCIFLLCSTTCESVLLSEILVKSQVSRYYLHSHGKRAFVCLLWGAITGSPCDHWDSSAWPPIAEEPFHTQLQTVSSISPAPRWC